MSKGVDRVVAQARGGESVVGGGGLARRSGRGGEDLDGVGVAGGVEGEGEV